MREKKLKELETGKKGGSGGKDMWWWWGGLSFMFVLELPGCCEFQNTCLDYAHVGLRNTIVRARL